MIRKKIVVIGGGTGTFTVLSGLKHIPNIDISVIVSMMDSGGSNRVIRDEFGLLPTSDIRQCILALASTNSDQTIRDLFNYRYTQGTGISGMTFGNLFMAALTDILKSQEKAIKETCRIMDVKGKVIPVTFDNSQLVATYDNGVQVLGEHFIDEPTKKTIHHRITNLEVFPQAKINPEATKVIKEADLIILGPGDLFTSILCNVVVDGMAKKIANSKAKKLYIANIMTRFGQTDGFGLKEHIDEIEKYLGLGSLDYCLFNNPKKISAKAIKWYKDNDVETVKNNYLGSVKVISKELASTAYYKKSQSDKLTRSLVRHDSGKLAKAIIELLYG
jgi:uncharacterized cofD-like protein